MTAELRGLDLAALRAHLDRSAPGVLDGPLHAELVQGGRSNLTYIVGNGERELVLRRPPLGHVLATAHDMSREHRVMGALAGSAVPVPEMKHYCADVEVLGAPFYLMERVHGLAMRSAQDTAWMTPEQATLISQQLIDVLAELHMIEPESVGLGDLGKPDGYLQRQLRRWNKQLESSRSRELPGIDELAEWLAAQLPETRRTAIVHGDYRLDNVLVRKEPLGISAVLDWEMATLGDPLADLGVLHVYWQGIGAVGDLAGSSDPITGGSTNGPGFPDFDALVQRYAAHCKADTGDLHWYVAFGYFKLAVVLEGIHYRFSHGQTVGEGFEKMGDVVFALIEGGLAARG